MTVGLAIAVLVVGFPNPGSAICPGADASQPQALQPKLVVPDWIPPKTTIAADYVATTKSLLGNGLADPRNRRFCRVRTMLDGGAWNRARATSLI